MIMIIIIIMKINLYAPYPEGSKLIFFTPFRAGANEENQQQGNFLSNLN
jgi:hypothetical protein